MLGEIEPVGMDQIDPLFGDRLLDCLALPPLDRAAFAVGDARRQRRGRDQAARDMRPLGGDDDRAYARR